MDSLKFIAKLLAAGALIAASAPAFAQSTALKQIHATAADYAAAQARTHIFLSATPRGTLGSGPKMRSDAGTLSGASKSAGSGGAHGAQFPGDLGNLFGGTTIQTAVNWAVYPISSAGNSCFAAGATVTNAVACWGNVAQFLGDLFSSNFIRITDQYVGSTAAGRYTFGPTQWGIQFPAVPVTPANPQGALTDADMAAFAHALAGLLGSGYGNVYHIFLPPEQVVCFDTSYTVCSSNYFCAYHSSAMTDIGEVVYTVEPNLVNVSGCNQPANSPNGGYDATYSVLSHEVFETFTDPDGLSWWNITNSALLGSEIGDECLFWLFDTNGNYISANPVTQTLNHRAYAIQTEYNNAAHACTTRSGALPE